jgi:hypothetical protein
MIEKNVVLILGAGASKPYGFPLGQELIDHILTMGDKPPLLPIDSGELLRFQRALKLAGRTSIDAFLERQDAEFVLIGKQLIAYLLSRYENEKDLYDTKRSGDDNKRWYQFLWEQIVQVDSGTLFDGSKVSIITYNYDRSLEFFLFNAVRQHFPAHSDGDCETLLLNLPIIHIHGKIGEPIYSTKVALGRKYLPIDSIDDLNTAVRGMMLISEAQPKNVLYEEAHKLIENADSIVFLGFGYHQDNMDRLEVGARSKQNANILCTTLGLTDSQEHFYIRKKLSPHPVTTNGFDCLTMLRYHLEIFYRP